MVSPRTIAATAAGTFLAWTLGYACAWLWTQERAHREQIRPYVN